MSTPAPPRATALAFDPATPGLWVGDDRGVVTFLGRSAGPAPLLAAAPIGHLAVSRDGAAVLIADDAGEVRVARAADGALVDAFACVGLLQAAVLAPRVYAAVDDRRRGAVWSPDADGALVPAPVCADGATPVPFDAFAAAPDGGRLTLVSAIDWLVWDRASNLVVAEHRPVDGMRLANLDGLAGASSDGARFFLHWDEHWLFDVDSEAMVGEGPLVVGATAAALCDGGRLLALGTEPGGLVVLDPGGAAVVRLTVSSAPVARVAVSPDGALVGWVDEEGAFGVVDTAAAVELVRGDDGRALLG